MNTLETLKNNAAEIMAKPFADRTKEEMKVVEIFNSLSSGKCGLAGKRTKKNHNKNW